jgi:hypothetical protein
MPMPRAGCRALARQEAQRLRPRAIPLRGASMSPATTAAPAAPRFPARDRTEEQTGTSGGLREQPAKSAKIGVVGATVARGYAGGRAALERTAQRGRVALSRHAQTAATRRDTRESLSLAAVSEGAYMQKKEVQGRVLCGLLKRGRNSAVAILCQRDCGSRVQSVVVMSLLTQIAAVCTTVFAAFPNFGSNLLLGTSVFPRTDEDT